MLLYPDNIEDKLEVERIRNAIKTFCITDAAKVRVEQCRPGADIKKLNSELQQTAECILILGLTEKPSNQFQDIIPHITKLGTDGTFLTAEDFLEFKIAMKTTYDWTRFLKRHKESYPALFKLTLGFISDRSLVDEIETKIDNRGEVRANATKELARIRDELFKAETRVRKSIRSILKSAKKDNYTDEESEITIREGRLVIPIRAEHKRKISGFVHDESSTGHTVFMEPSSVLELNNQVRELHYQEKREIQRILLELADKIRLQLDDLEKGGKFLVLLDFILAKANFAMKYKAHIPTVVKTPSVNLVNAFHPLLKMFNEENGKHTVPLNLKLDHRTNRLCVISGPNAGGKSVAMKTVGLLQYMLQCGFPVTADEESVFGVFNNIFIDIGDSQSLENDLSTYSSRLTAMKYFSEFADKKTLILIDEFGTGTEPQFGGAIAESILTRISETGSYGVITTHYANIKEFADREKGMVNGAMRYDTGKLEPLFHLEVGKPGSSFAFEIARKIGLSQEIIREAKRHVGSSQVNYDKLLTELEGDKVRYENRNKEITRKEQDVRELKKDYEALKKMVETEKGKILKEAREEARQIIAGANRKIENAVREIQESKADKHRTKKVRDDIESYRKKLTSSEPKSVKMKLETRKDFKTGDRVRIKGQESVGEILRIKSRQAQVSFGNLTSYVDTSRLELISKKKAKEITKKRIGGLDLTSKMASFSSELDVRGKKAEEVIAMIDQFIDNAILLGVGELKILHGKGYGVLREVIRTHLNEDPNVISLADEHEDRGGSGITLIRLK